LGLPEILETIRAESEKTASGLIVEAESEAEEMLSRARDEASSEERRLAGSLDDRIRLERARVLSRGHLDAARVRRAAREDLYADAIEAVIQRLADERSSRGYEGLMGSLLDEALATMPGATTLSVDSGDVAVMERVLASKNLDIEVEARETPLGGLVLMAPGRTVDNTLATRLARADNHLRFVAGEIIPELRGGGSG
jgi:vacuolar-type H+-ATPase subunit E/Vma4